MQTEFFWMRKFKLIFPTTHYGKYHWVFKRIPEKFCFFEKVNVEIFMSFWEFVFWFFVKRKIAGKHKMLLTFEEIQRKSKSWLAEALKKLKMSGFQIQSFFNFELFKFFSFSKLLSSFFQAFSSFSQAFLALFKLCSSFFKLKAP